MARPHQKPKPTKPAKAGKKEEGKMKVVSNSRPKVVPPKPVAKPAGPVPLESDSEEEEGDEEMFTGAAVEDAEIEEEGAVDEEEEDEEGDVDDEEGDEDDSDVDDEDDVEGMERLVKAIGEDGLDDIAQGELAALGGEGDEDDEGDEDEEDESGDEREAAGESSEGEGGENAPNGMDVEPASDEEGSEADEDEEIALDDVDGEVDEDAVPKQKVTINNQAAMRRIRETIDLKGMDWTETLVTTYPHKMDDEVKDPDDDLDRELQFYKQALWGAEHSRELAKKFNLPFTRPADYYAEMVKSDAHMERVRARLLDERATIKKSEERKRQRDLKKFGKQVQVEKLKEREREKKEVGERLKSLKRKRKGALDGDSGGLADEEFDIALEDALADRPAKRGRGGKASMSREQRDKKFRLGAGGGKRSKQNTRESTDGGC